MHSIKEMNTYRGYHVCPQLHISTSSIISYRLCNLVTGATRPFIFLCIDFMRIRLGVDEMILLKWILGKNRMGRCGLDLSQDRGQWRALVNTIMNIRVPEKAVRFLII